MLVIGAFILQKRRYQPMNFFQNCSAPLGLEDARDEVRKLEEARKVLDKGNVVEMPVTQAKFKIV